MVCDQDGDADAGEEAGGTDLKTRAPHNFRGNYSDSLCVTTDPKFFGLVFKVNDVLHYEQMKHLQHLEKYEEVYLQPVKL